MKIAAPVTIDNQIDGHFGQAENFRIYEISDKKITGTLDVQSYGCGCKSNIAQTLAQMGVQMMLAGNMGQGAVNKLQGMGISVVRGCAGNVRAVTEKWLAGTISDSGKACSAHEHGHNCAH